MALEHLGRGTMPVVHAVPEAVLPLLAAGATARPGPVAVAEGLEARLPDLLEIVFLDIPLL